MNEKQLKKWEKIRNKGKMRFILVNGVVYWGVFTALLWSFFMAKMSGTPFLSYFCVAIIMFPVGGLAFGFLVWKMSEKKYLTAKGNSECC